MAYSRKVQRISEDIEKLARVSRIWMDRSITKELWLAQNILFQMAKSLKDVNG